MIMQDWSGAAKASRPEDRRREGLGKDLRVHLFYERGLSRGPLSQEREA